MNNQVITNTFRENFNISNMPEFNSEPINLALINRNIELKLESELADIENEMEEIELMLSNRGEATGVYATLLVNLEKTVLSVHDLFESMDGADQIEVSLILEKVKVKLLRLNEKMDVLATFVYAWNEKSA